jgi:hypothetical protein
VNSINLCTIIGERLTMAAISHISPKITIFNSNFTSLTLHTHNRNRKCVCFLPFGFLWCYFFCSTLFFCGGKTKKKQARKKNANSKGFSEGDHRRRCSGMNDLEAMKGDTRVAFFDRLFLISLWNFPSSLLLLLLMLVPLSV